MADLFPPAPFDEAFKQLAIYDAWYSNNLDNLLDQLGTPATHMHQGRPHTGGLMGALNNGVFGTPENRSSLTIPTAGDLAQLSADLLFAEAPEFTLCDSKDTADVKATPERVAAQERLEVIMGSDQAHAELLRSGEYAAAHGGAYLACTWDKAFEDHVWPRAYRADCAIPEFRYGRLSAVTLWTEYEKKDAVYRLFERHDPGRITYSLWKGMAGLKGSQVNIGAIPETEHYGTLIDVSNADLLPGAPTMDIVVKFDVPWLAVEFYPNMLPNPEWDKKGVLANLGRSDFYKIEPLFSRINAIWSSLMRDFDNGMGRLSVPESYLKLNGPGKGASFEMGRQVYSPLGGLVDDGKGGQITISQFAIRLDEHIGAIDELKREIALATGYSVSHFGVKGTGTQKTATEVSADFKDSERTRDKKALYVRPALSRLARTALAIDALVFPGMGGMLIEDLPEVEFAEVSQVDPEARARTIQLLDAARAISVRAKVAMAQPQLSETDADTEADMIRAENGMAPEADPTVIDD
ncbi:MULTISPECIES: hypothetical protein [unclassified Cryobacterium]|uniref:hypothetical protein n=1 Tax=unclassified Cryobacterium TaxID=2649013 RepID=UPI002AB5D641|nr:MULTISPECIES: hypothetical protein [unclassified Cryobacterium]MDY7542612.1 hypothetical protein [Cryobacterium sp. 5B3]MEB0264732.1 hypothetical protein [Cryobacterium sp. 10I5]MEB0273704.1 hypothetical protein [Cryobacterium sp. 5B3]